ncbi:hypothetical protein [Flaviflexus equikiangi]|uniref:Uncharacterized protein n=1 Tax=Flaviflexus equikiangi TaxID=2758573 RepID=A0ABS2THI4_9ACTO|nr:hypothetical protein [Flaviflexus equikiangi]MBM9434123.1 hypothetical protein [Flaviflexus equikiangi]
MNDLLLLGDSQGYLIAGEQTDVDLFLADNDLTSREFPTARLGGVLAASAGATEAGASISASYGRWVKLTEKSATAMKQGSLMTGSTKGVNKAIVTDGKNISSILEIVTSPAALLMNPAVLTGAAGIMAQLAMHQAMDDITDYLESIDRKCDDILRAQKDAVLSDMIGVGAVLDEAMTIRDSVGSVNEVAWSKIQGSAFVLARTQAYALSQIRAVAVKIDGTNVDKLADRVKEGQRTVEEWLVVLARCTQLWDALSVLELDRVLATGIDQLEDHRRGLEISRRERLDKIHACTTDLIHRISRAAAVANEKILLNPLAGRRLVSAGRGTLQSVHAFHEHLDLEESTAEIEGRRWLEAVADVRDDVVSRGSDGALAVKRIGENTVGNAKNVGSKLGETLQARFKKNPPPGQAGSEDATR